MRMNRKPWFRPGCLVVLLAVAAVSLSGCPYFVDSRVRQSEVADAAIIQEELVDLDEGIITPAQMIDTVRKVSPNMTLRGKWMSNETSDISALMPSAGGK